MLPQLTRDQVQKLLRELKSAGLVSVTGKKPNFLGGSQEPARLQLRRKVSKKYQSGVIPVKNGPVFKGFQAGFKRNSAQFGAIQYTAIHSKS